MKVALLQIRVTGGETEKNETRAHEALESGIEASADLLVLPELWNVGYFATEAYQTAAEPLDGPTLSRISEVARKNDVWILAGSIIEDLQQTITTTPAEDGYSNTSVLFDPGGNRRATYRKHHLFGYESAESELLVPGQRLETAEIGGFTVGITTCYDLRFPELYRELTDRGVTMVLVPSAWPYPRVEHWETLTTTRALENLFYVVAVNGSGPAGGDGLIGRSRVIDPWGTAVRTAGPEAETLLIDVEPDRVKEIRDEFPALTDRRF